MPKTRTIPSLGVPRSTAASTPSLRSFQYGFIPARSRMPINPHQAAVSGGGTRVCGGGGGRRPEVVVPGYYRSGI
jgi:hypothetical protein